MSDLNIIPRKEIFKQIDVSRDTLKNWIKDRNFSEPLKSSGTKNFGPMPTCDCIKGCGMLSLISFNLNNIRIFKFRERIVTDIKMFS